MRLPAAIDTPIRTLIGCVALPLALVVLSAVAIALALARRNDATVHKAYQAFGHFTLWIAGTDLVVSGADHAKSSQAYVVVSNHESNLDPPSLLVALPHVLLRFIVKRELVRIPVFGQAIGLTGNVVVQRTQAREDVERVRERMEERRGGVSMLFFAEGTRTRDGEMQPFKKGAFASAITHGLPILPVAIAGTRHIWPPGWIRLRRGRVAVEVGEPIPVEDLGFSNRDALRSQVEEIVSGLRARAYARLAGD